MSLALCFRGLSFLVALASAGTVSARAAEPADLPALEQAWHSCVRQANRGISLTRVSVVLQAFAHASASSAPTDARFSHVSRRCSRSLPILSRRGARCARGLDGYAPLAPLIVGATRQ